MKLTAWTTIASMLMYIWVFANVGNARRTYKISAPATDGPIEFLTALRVQANTVEQLILFLPLLWMCCYFLSDVVAAVLGSVWVVGRVIYALGYYQAPGKRTLGFAISSFAGVGLLGSTIYGLLFH
jgi:uncharacterized membrane protein YecN with MAPEG domain